MSLALQDTYKITLEIYINTNNSIAMTEYSKKESYIIYEKL